MGAAGQPVADGVIDIHVKEKRYQANTVLADLRITLKAGERVAVLGPSGVGKSTLLRIVAGIDTDFEGTITRPERMAMVFQEPTLLPWRSALHNLTLIHPGLGDDGARAALAAVGLEGKEDLFPGQLSLGQQRRLALARAFAFPPEFLILDEPFVSLDKKLSGEMIALTRRLLDDHAPALLFVTHEAREAQALGARQLFLSGSPATISGERPG